MARRARSFGGSTRRRETPAITPTVIKGLVTLGVLGALVALALTAISGVPFRGYSKVYVDLPSLGNLRQHDEVVIGGVRVGQVASETTTAKGARVVLQINPGVVLRTGTQAAIRANGLLGAREVQLIPGTGQGTLNHGGTITVGKNALTYGVPDLIDTFNQKTRGGLGQTVNGLGTGFAGNGMRLNDGFKAVGPATQEFSEITDQALATGSAGKLVPGLESMMSALDADKHQLVQVFEPGSSALQPIVTQRGQTRQSIADAPSTLDTATGGLASGTHLIDAAKSLAVSVNAVGPTIPGALKDTASLLNYAKGSLPGGGTPLTRVNTLLGSAKSAVPAVLHITKALKPALPRLNALSNVGTPIIKSVYPYTCDIVNFAEGLRSMTGYGSQTATGPGGPAMAFRLQAILGVSSLGVKDPLVHRIGYSPACFNDGGTFIDTYGPLAGAGAAK